MNLFPTRQWLDEYGRLLDESSALADLSCGWALGLDGDLMLVITDIPLAETTLGDLPEEIFADLPNEMQAQLADLTLAEAPSTLDESVRPSLPESIQNLLAQIEHCIIDETIYAYFALQNGNCTEVAILDDPDDREAGSVVSGPCRTWQEIVDGRPAASAVLNGDLTIEGNTLLQLQNTAVLQLLGNIATDVDTTHLFERSRSPLSAVVLDEAVRHPLAIQRLVHQQAAWAVRTISPF
jgi:putative sterol carrier protein